MALCLRKKHVCRCQNRCESFFPSAPELAQGCKSLCRTGRTEFSRDEYLCSEYVPESEVIRRYGFDPCFGTDVTVQSYADPVGERERKEQQRQDNTNLLQNILLGGSAVVVLALLILWLIKRK